jgi:predicted lipoprotein with Yx(FWY)xxD motif
MKRAVKATLACGAMLLAATISGCSAGNTTSPSTAVSSSAAPSATPSASAAADARTTIEQATVTTRNVGNLGQILVNQNGRTMYLFEADRSAQSTCYGACAAAWPPVLTSGTPKAAGGVKSDQLATSKRNGGSSQVVYHGHPLYLFAGDSRPGNTNGQALNQFGAQWFVVNPDGNKVTTG